jgi:hypothetical protein
MVSNAVSEIAEGKRMHSVARQRQHAICLAVHRVHDSVYFKRLEPEAFDFLRAMKEGKSLSAAVQLSLHRSGDERELLVTVMNWFESWSKLGWFCRPNSANQNFISSSERQL